MGLGRVELPTSRLSGVRSNHLSYRPLNTSGNLSGAYHLKKSALENRITCTTGRPAIDLRVVELR